jgi:hypothetical protein
LGAGHQGLVDSRQRARRTGRQPGARLPHLRARRRLLRLAVELLRFARRRARRAQAARHGGASHPTTRWVRTPHRSA